MENNFVHLLIRIRHQRFLKKFLNKEKIYINIIEFNTS